jgi:hypothetical protein
MSAIACTQQDVMPDTCPACGGWLHRIQHGGFPGPHGWGFCEPACVDDQVEYEARAEVDRHLYARDLLCGLDNGCQVCARRGLPTQAMRDEYAAYRAVEGGGPTP